MCPGVEQGQLQLTLSFKGIKRGEEDSRRRRAHSFPFFWLQKMSACIRLYGYWHKIQPYTHTLKHSHTHRGGKEAARKARREVSRKEKDGGEERRRRPSGPRRSHSHSQSGGMREPPQSRTVARSGSWSLVEDLMLILGAAHIHFALFPLFALMPVFFHLVCPHVSLTLIG